MKTIDLLVQELPALGGWPDGAVEAGFLCSDDTLFFVNKDGDCPSGWRINMNHEVEDKWVEVTREQYEASLAAKNEGWIEWGGGRCPVDDVTEVDIKFRTGGIAYGVEAGKYYWPRTRQEYDIIAYRLHKLQDATTRANDCMLPQDFGAVADEANLNDCIGQDAAPVWNGEGLPPVGCECQYRKHKKSEQSEWVTGVVKYASEFTVVIQPVCYPGETVGHPANFEFRPIRSAEDEKRDDRASAIDGFISGFRGQETGSNKELAYALTDYLALLDKL